MAIKIKPIQEDDIMSRNLLFTVVFVCVALIFSVCGEKTDKPETPEPTKTEAKETPAPAATEDEGVLVGKEILETFDKAVTEAAELVKEKPGVEELKPKLEALYKAYEETMKGLNTKYLALKEKDIAIFGSCNGYLGENRGKHVFNKDKVMDAYIVHYRSQEGGEEIAQFLSKDIINLLEVAVKR